MRLKVINSNSAGNCYILENESEALIIECGVNIKKIKQAIDFKISKVVSAIVTHEHKDHSIAMMDLLNCAIPVWATTGTHTAMGTGSHAFARYTHSGNEFKVGNFRVLAFNTVHDAAEPIGFLIYHPETGTVLFLTDTQYSEFKFEGLNQIIVEANYSQKILSEKVANGYILPFLHNRIIKSHMNIETTVDLLKANDLSEVVNIVLIHLSDSNSDAALFKQMVEKETVKTVHVAEPGLNIDFNLKPF